MQKESMTETVKEWHELKNKENVVVVVGKACESV